MAICAIGKHQKHQLLACGSAWLLNSPCHCLETHSAPWLEVCGTDVVLRPGVYQTLFGSYPMPSQIAFYLMDDGLSLLISALILAPIHRTTGTAQLLPMALYLCPSGQSIAGLLRHGIIV